MSRDKLDLLLSSTLCSRLSRSARTTREKGTKAGGTPAPQGRLHGHDALNRVGFDNAGQFLIQAAVEVGQLLVVEAHQVQNRGVQVADVMAIDDRLVPSSSVSP